MSWQIVYAKKALKDAKKLSSSGLKPKAEQLFEIMKIDPYANPPPFERLIGDLDGVYSRRINIQHRLVYEIFTAERTVRILKMWSHYE